MPFLEASRDFPILPLHPHINTNQSFRLPPANVSEIHRAIHQANSDLIGPHVLRRNLPPQSTMSLIPSGFFGNRSIYDPFSTFDAWDPFRDFPFSSSSLIPRSEVSGETAAFANARIDWRETPEAHVFKADIPGVRKEEVKVEIEDGNVLSISGQRKRDKEEKTDTWHRVERSSGQFVRRFRLPENARAEGIKAAMDSGVLTVTVPKVEVKKPDVKPIQITG